MSAYSTALLALDGQADSNGNTIDILRYFPMDDSSGTACVDATGTANGTYVNSPTLRASGPLMPETGGGYGVTFNGTSQFVNCGSATALANAINNDGLSMVGWLKSSSAADIDGIFGFANGTSLCYAAYNINYNTNYAAGAAAISFFNSGFANQRGEQAVPGDGRFSDGQWHMVVMQFRKTGQIARFWWDRILQVTQGVTAGTMADISAGTSSFGIGAWMTGPLDVNVDGASYFNGSIAHVAFFSGLLTQAQLTTLYTAASTTYLGVPIRGARYNASSSAYQDDTLLSPCAENDEILAVKDLSGNANHLLSNTPGTVPRLTLIHGRRAMNFDNFYADGGPASSPAKRQQILKSASALGKMLPCHCGIIVVCRPLVGSVSGISDQVITGMFAAGPTIKSGLNIPNAGSSGDSEVCHRTGTTNNVGNGSATTWKKLTSLPSIAIIGCTVGQDGVHVTSSNVRLFFNRWKSNSAGTVPAATAATTAIHIGGYETGLLNGDNLFAGLIEEVIYTTPFSDAEFDAFASAYMASAGQTLNPRYHVTMVGTSIDSLNGATYNQNPLARLPAAAVRNCSWRNLAYSSGRVSGSINVDYDERTLNSAKSWDGGSTCTEWLLIGGPINDAGDATAINTISTNIDTVISQATTGGADFVAACSCSTPNSDGVRGPQINAAVVAKATVRRFITYRDLTGKLESDNLHVLDSGAQQMSEDIWNQWAMASITLKAGSSRSRTRSR